MSARMKQRGKHYVLMAAFCVARHLRSRHHINDHFISEESSIFNEGTQLLSDRLLPFGIHESVLGHGDGKFR